MPIELTAVPMPASPPIRIVEPGTLALLGRLATVVLLAGLIVGLQCRLDGCPSEPLQTIAGP